MPNVRGEFVRLLNVRGNIRDESETFRIVQDDRDDEVNEVQALSESIISPEGESEVNGESVFHSGVRPSGNGAVEERNLSVRDGRFSARVENGEVLTRQVEDVVMKVLVIKDIAKEVVSILEQD